MQNTLDGAMQCGKYSVENVYSSIFSFNKVNFT